MDAAGLSIRRIAFATADTADRRGLRDIFLHLYLRVERTLTAGPDAVDDLRQASLVPGAPKFETMVWQIGKGHFLPELMPGGRIA